MTLIPTLWNRDSCNKIYEGYPSKVLLFIALHILICFTINASPYTVSPDTCLDSDKPTISIAIGNCTPATFNQSLNTCTGYLSIKAQATDNLTPEELLLFDYKIDLYNDGRGPYNGFDIRVGALSLQQYKAGNNPQLQDNPFAENNRNPFDASGTYPIGIHKICWYVEDSCGNTAALCQLFEVRDCEAPTLICVGGLQIFNMPVNGCITLFARDFNRGSFDNCTSPDKLIFYFNGDITKKTMDVCCDDYVAAGLYPELPLNFQLWVKDEMNNTDYCDISALVIDNWQTCPIDFSSFTAYGNLYAIKNGFQNITIQNIRMNSYQNGTLLRSFITNNFYKFSYGYKKGPYTLEALKDNDSLNNVSTLDIIYIERHLHGLKIFDNKFQSIAADVNKNNEISYSDISEIRNLILGTTTQFTYSLPWKIIATSKDSMPLNNQDEKLLFEFDKELKVRFDFQIIKMGDVNDFASPSNYIPLNNTNDSLVFKYENHQFKKGDIVKIDIFSRYFNSILGFQGTINFNNQKLDYLKFYPSTITLNTSSFGTNSIKKGLLTISWNDIYPRTYSTNVVLFSLEFEALQDGDLCDAISFTSDLTPAEAYTDSVLIKKIRLESCDVPLSNDDLIDQNIIVYPNPFNGILHFRISDNVVFPVELNLYDQNGKKIETTKIQSTQSQFSWKLNSIHSGIYFVKITNEQKIIFKKIVKL
jgi:hypothetical protein